MIYATDSFESTVTRLMDVGVCWHCCQQTFSLNVLTMSKKEKVSELLKPKTAQLGFTQEELESVVESLSGNLADDASDEDINAQIDAVIPYLALSQKAANRAIQAARQKQQVQPGSQQTVQTQTSTQEDERLAQLITAATQKAISPYIERINQLESDARNRSYAQSVETALKDVDRSFYEMALDGREFKSQSDVDTFVSTVKTKWQSFSEKHSQKKLTFSLPAGHTSKGDEIDDVAEYIRSGGESKQDPNK